MSASPPLLQAVSRHLAADPRPFEPPCLLVAVSGGADSVALLRALHALLPEPGRTLVVAHLHHGLRGAEADADAAFVTDLAATLGLPARVGRADVAAQAARERLSPEDAARRARRRFLEATRAEEGASVIALGHTRDDQAETVLLNLLRGAGPRGLAAMPAHGPGRITRPLLRVRRAEARAFLQGIGQPWREDGSNADPAFTRNRIRHDLLPRLAEAFNPAIADTLARQAELFAELDAFLTGLAAAWLDRPEHTRGAGLAHPTLALATRALAAEPVALRAAIWRAAAERLGGGVLDWGRVHHEALDAVLHSAEDGEAHLPAGWRVTRQGRWIWLSPASAGLPEEPSPEASAPPRELRLTTGSELCWGSGVVRVTRLAGGPATAAALRPPDGRRSALFDADLLATGDALPLMLRAARAGDNFAPFGPAGHRPLTHVLADAGIPAARRPRTPVLALNSGEILWIPGVARSDRAPVGPATRRSLLLEWFGPPPGDLPNE